MEGGGGGGHLTSKNPVDVKQGTDGPLQIRIKICIDRSQIKEWPEAPRACDKVQ